ncbi:unnamed protein product [Periconia digitata]|uniref:Uncharacterized protein n=1 Tax=Periconia digitata TaxID=1303443 RepID=A0A9W4UIY9_9PLEO|nr:unnamed protein product [Periconia digitata]
MQKAPRSFSLALSEPPSVSQSGHIASAMPLLHQGHPHPYRPRVSPSSISFPYPAVIRLLPRGPRS